jgi:tetratricopeptide (TPR) repeat protein
MERGQTVSKLLLFGGLWWLFGNPFIAILVLLALLYILERRFIGLSPSIVRPFRRKSAIARWKRHLHLSPHDVSARTELARLLIESRKYGQAREILLGIREQSEHSAEYWSDLGTCDLALGRLEEGEEDMRRALSINARVKYGQPYLRMGGAWSKRDPSKALGYLEAFKEVNSSSCEAYYRLGELYADLAKPQEAAAAFRECRVLYSSLPRYMKRRERKWALKSLLRGSR